MPFIDEFPLQHVITIFTLFLLALPLKVVTLENSSNMYVIHMDKSLMPMAFSSHKTWYTSILGVLMNEHPTPVSNYNLSSKSMLVYTYNNVINGFSAFLSLDQLEALNKFHGFLVAHKSDTNFILHSTYTSQYLKLNHANGLWPISNYGKDIIVGVIDTGIWPENPSFGDFGMTNNIPRKWNGSCEGAGEDFNSSLCNYKLIGAKYFNEGFKKVKPSDITSNDSARDIDGHGTFVSSIAVGNYVSGVSYFGYAKGTAKGIAPRARLSVYKVIWDSNTVTSDDVLAGVDQAIDDGVDVISASFTSPDSTKLHNNSLAIASFAAMEKGIVVVCAAGNHGPAFGTVDNAFPWVLTVGASTINRWFAGVLTLGDGLNITGWSLYTGNSSILLQNLPLVYNSIISKCEANESFSNVPYGIIICQISNGLQLYDVSKANVTGAVLFSSNPTSLEFEKFDCACIVVSSKDAQIVIDYAENHENPLASIAFQQTIIDTNPSPTLANYSSRGPSYSYKHILKPDVIAPGSFILGAVSPTLEANKSEHIDYAIMSGTSMACPHVAGLVALLKAKHPKWSPAAIRSAIMTTASLLDDAGNSIKDNAFPWTLATPLGVGSGLIDPNKVLDPGLVYDATRQDYINLLCSLNFSKEQLVTIIRSNTYDCSNPSGDLNYPSFIVFYHSKSTLMVKEFRRTVTNVGENVASYDVVVKTPPNFEVTVSPKKLEFKKKYEKQSYNVTVKYSSNTIGNIFFGAIFWVEETRKHFVSSPIVVTHDFNIP